MLKRNQAAAKRVARTKIKDSLAKVDQDIFFIQVRMQRDENVDLNKELGLLQKRIAELKNIEQSACSRSQSNNSHKRNSRLNSKVCEKQRSKSLTDSSANSYVNTTAQSDSFKAPLKSCLRKGHYSGEQFSTHSDSVVYEVENPKHDGDYYWRNAQSYGEPRRDIDYNIKDRDASARERIRELERKIFGLENREAKRNKPKLYQKYRKVDVLSEETIARERENFSEANSTADQIDAHEREMEQDVQTELFKEMVIKRLTSLMLLALNFEEDYEGDYYLTLERSGKLTPSLVPFSQDEVTIINELLVKSRNVIISRLNKGRHFKS